MQLLKYNGDDITGVSLYNASLSTSDKSGKQEMAAPAISPAFFELPYNRSTRRSQVRRSQLYNYMTPKSIPVPANIFFQTSSLTLQGWQAKPALA